jgi:cation transport ATPase
MNQVPVEPEPNASCPRLSALFRRRKSAIIALVAMAAIFVHLILRFGFKASWFLDQIPLLAALAFGGFPLVYELTQKIFRRQFGSDLLAGFSIVTSVLLGEYLAGTIVVLMLSGGETLESYALGNAASALRALAKRIPSVAHRRQGSVVVDVAPGDIKVGDTLLVYPHDICPVDGSVIEGFGVMNESFLTGEPFAIVVRILASGATNE